MTEELEFAVGEVVLYKDRQVKILGYEPSKPWPWIIEWSSDSRLWVQAHLLSKVPLPADDHEPVEVTIPVRLDFAAIEIETEGKHSTSFYLPERARQQINRLTEDVEAPSKGELLARCIAFAYFVFYDTYDLPWDQQDEPEEIQESEEESVA